VEKKHIETIIKKRRGKIFFFQISKGSGERGGSKGKGLQYI